MSYTRLRLDSTPTSIREAREATRAWLRNVGRSVAEHPAALIVSELVTNALEHGRGPIVLHLCDQTDRVRIGVSDGSPTVAYLQPRRRDGRAGHGMYIVERLSLNWGSEISETGKTTWAEIPT